MVSIHEKGWSSEALRRLQSAGYCIVQDVLDSDFLDASRSALYRAQEAIVGEVGRERLQGAGEIGTLRLPMKFDPFFYRFLEIPEVLEIVDATVGPTSILHLQNGFILPSFDAGATPHVFQNKFHRDFPRYMGGYLASINVFFAIDAFTETNGATLVVPGSHQKEEVPGIEEFEARAVPATAPAGAMLIFDSTLWHAAGKNVSGRDRLAINHQFTRSFFKQQIDYVRALGEERIVALPERTQQLLGWYTRVVTSLDEYYQPAERRLYRAGQG
ncbi:MAG: phytanoyl-CoA dioxygenase family protein [Candidatus Eremiobacteraeota bacterium]|nr:phytanoyl-CoA dioxygenase family protein [Candidatus Eremiobacteraeota bacterium]